jgi:hypothetical protein
VQVLVEIIVQIVGEIVGHSTGRIILSVVTPHIQVLPFSNSVSPPKQGWFSLTYTKDGQRYYFDETVMATGLLFWVTIIIAVSIALS